MSECRYCGKEIEWLQRAGGGTLPVDAEPVFVIEGDGCERFYDADDEGKITGEIVGRAARPDEVRTPEQKMNTPLGWVPHWKTCRRGR